MTRNVQIVLEDMTRCGGNCSGCSLMSAERMQKSNFDFDGLALKVRKTRELLDEMLKEGEDTVESVSLFFGQGDHFLMSNEEIVKFVDICGDIIPDKLLSKTVLFVTASAIGVHDEIVEKMNLFYGLFLERKISFFVQSVFDPKKYTQYKNFKEKYLKNILFFKEKCYMTELTINLGEDVVENMSPKDFHNFMIDNGFYHIEFNWIMSQLTVDMWEKKYEAMFAWLKELVLLNKEEHKYEINFLPIMSLNLLNKEKTIAHSRDEIGMSLENNIYIGSNGDVNIGQMGLINNLTTVEERVLPNLNNIVNFTSGLGRANLSDFKDGNELLVHIVSSAKVAAKKIQSSVLNRSSCRDCGYKMVCAVGGSEPWFKYYRGEQSKCPWGIVDFYKFIEENIDVKTLKTVFDKNPVPSVGLQTKNNYTGIEIHNKFYKG